MKVIRHMKKGTKRYVVFSDLDGTLLDHLDYSYAAAEPALESLAQRGIPLIMCTSKTRGEVEALQSDMRRRDPFIVENGGAIFFPQDDPGFTVRDAIVMYGYTCRPLGVPYARIRAFMQRFKEEFALHGFGDMTPEEIADHTGLSVERAAMAKAREFTEPFLMAEEGRLGVLARLARQEGLKITRGGRFLHLMGERNDKGLAVKQVKAIYAENWRTSPITIGLGDSPNDFPMLALVDHPVLIPHHDGRYEDIMLPRLTLAKYPGSKGWNDALGSFLDMLTAKEDTL